MSKRDDAKEILKSLGLPKPQQNERSCLTLLALAALDESTPWAKAGRPLLRIWDIMGWMKEKYGKEYAANSRETIRRQTVHQFEQASPSAGAQSAMRASSVFHVSACSWALRSC